MKKVLCLGLVLSLLCGCALLPAEEELRKAPVVQQMEEEYFTTEAVSRGDVQDYIGGNCRYDFQRRADYSFGYDIMPFTSYISYVNEGDKVKEGQLLAKVIVEENEEALKAKQEEMDGYAEELEHQKKLLEIEQKRQKLAKDYGRKYDTAALERLENTVSSLEETILVEQIRFDELKAQVDGTQIVAEFDGVVSFLDNPRNSWYYPAGSTFISIRTEQRTFSANVENTDKIQVGDLLDVESGENFYTCEVIEVTKSSEEARSMGVHLLPLDPDEFLLELDESTSVGGTLRLITEEAKDVVRIPTGALRIIDEKPAVYVLDANGMRELRYIEIGLSISGKIGDDENMTEVISGLEPGELVIIR